MEGMGWLVQRLTDNLIKTGPVFCENSDLTELKQM